MVESNVWTGIRKENERNVLFNKRPNPVYIAKNSKTGETVGICMRWFSDEWTSSPVYYFTPDQGKTFYRVSSSMTPDEARLQIGEEERNPDTLISLHNLLTEYHRLLATEPA